MTIRIKMFLVPAAVLVMTAMANAHCLDYRTTGPVRLVIGVDRSLSTAGAQADVWLQMAGKLTNCLRQGDAVTVLEIQANTAQTGPVFDAPLPIEPPNATIPQKVAVRNEIFKIRTELGGKLKALFAAPRDAEWTDILGAFERIHDSKRQNLMVLFTDGIHSTPDLDLERVRLGTKFVLDLQRFNLRQGMWKDTPTSVYFVLPSLPGQKRQPDTNDRATLNRFYESIINHIGGKLASFSVDLLLVN